MGILSQKEIDTLMNMSADEKIPSDCIICGRYIGQGYPYTDYKDHLSDTLCFKCLKKKKNKLKEILK